MLIFQKICFCSSTNNQYADSGVTDIVYQQDKVIKQWFPHLNRWFNQVPDPRKFHTYSIGNLLVEGLFLFLSGESSRNSLNNRAEHGMFYKSNFSKLFEGMNLAHFDTVDDLCRQLDYEQIETVKTRMIRSLIKNKRLGNFSGIYYIAIDATGVTTYDEDRRGTLLKKKSKTGKEAYLNIMLEAKVITPEGMSISIASEPLNNKETDQYRKQDCELKAFGRITEKIKKYFPRLPVCLLLDGLYSNGTVMEICERYKWHFISVLKDGSLSRLQEQVRDTREKERIRFEKPTSVKEGNQTHYYGTTYQCIEGVSHKGHKLTRVECITPLPRKKAGEQVKTTRFVYLTNIKLRHDPSQKPAGIIKITEAGRMRWKVENEGFNTQKNGGYHLHHKFSRYSAETLHVYYMLLQIAHLINQLVQHSLPVKALMKRYRKLTIKYLWDKLRQVLEWSRLSELRLEDNKQHCQIRLE